MTPRMGDEGRCPYRALGISVDSSEKEAEKAFRREALRSHPDKGGSNAEFADLKAALEEIRTNKKSMKARLDRNRCLSATDTELADLVSLEGGLFAYECRCGDIIEVSLQEVAEGFDVFCCSSCSLAIRLVCDPVAASGAADAAGETAVESEASDGRGGRA
eukprot:GHVU01020567.1.p2 GENE.GHVU01020567.1~~GHVU01020567.1.p2  ORF type:complete len:161 (+),score=29.22 GHVU01020567.1:208-690(+)